MAPPSDDRGNETPSPAATRRWRGRRSSLLVLAAVAAAIAVAGLVAALDRSGEEPARLPGQPGGPTLSPGAASAPVTVVTVLDGATVRARSGGREREVRLIGLQVPGPDDCYGRESLARARSLLEGRAVVLETDPLQGSTDPDGRSLAYFQLPDGRFYDEVMLSGGYARLGPEGPGYVGRPRLQAAQSRAQRAERGIWSTTCRR